MKTLLTFFILLWHLQLLAQQEAITIQVKKPDTATYDTTDYIFLLGAGANYGLDANNARYLPEIRLSFPAARRFWAGSDLFYLKDDSLPMQLGVGAHARYFIFHYELSASTDFDTYVEGTYRQNVPMENFEQRTVYQKAALNAGFIWMWSHNLMLDLGAGYQWHIRNFPANNGFAVYSRLAVFLHKRYIRKR